METDLVKSQISQLQMLVADEERKMKKYKVCHVYITFLSFVHNL
jgi:hypothetical protein